MADKQIIIDGVDVSECEYYNKDDKTCREVNGNYDTDICEFDKCENSNCYYKQLQREKQKNNRLDKRLTSFMNGDGCSLKQQLDQLKAEKEEFKQTLIEIQQDLEFATYCESQECGCDDPNECLECTKKQIIQKISEMEDKN